MKRLYITFMSVILVASCGQSGTLEAENTTLGSALSLNSEDAALQVSHARNICNAFRSKRIKAQSASLVDAISYVVEETNCTSDTVNSKDIDVTLSLSLDGQLQLTDRTNTLQEPYLQTDLMGQLPAICTKVFNNEEPSYNEYISATQVKVIKFTSSNEFYVALGIQDSFSTTGYKLIEKATYTVEIESPTAQTYGLVNLRNRESLCSSDKQVYFKRILK